MDRKQLEFLSKQTYAMDRNRFLKKQTYIIFQFIISFLFSANNVRVKDIESISLT